LSFTLLITSIIWLIALERDYHKGSKRIGRDSNLQNELRSERSETQRMAIFQLHERLFSELIGEELKPNALT
jgi:hypothetical protein